MKVVSVEDMHVAGVWGELSFLKITTDDGLVGWSEFNEEFQTRTASAFPGLTILVRQLASRIIGSDPRNVGAIEVALRGGMLRPHAGMEQQAIAALVNGCLDIKAKHLGVRVCDLLGGTLRDRIPVYWSHCGSYRVAYPDAIDGAPVASLDDIRALGAEVRARGFRALKTNDITPHFGGGRYGTQLNNAYPRRVADSDMLDRVGELLTAFREGAGPDVRLALDINCLLKPEATRALARFLERFDLMWLELDTYRPADLARIRWSTSTPIGSLENTFGARDVLPYLEAGAVDVCIVDVQYNGFLESLRMAAVADAHDVNVASHSACSGLSVLFAAHFCASIPNLAVMEYDVDQPTWTARILSDPPVVVDGHLVMPERPGWGTDVLEEGVLANPPAENPLAPWLLDFHRKRGAL